MELGLGNSLLAGDPRLIDHIVGEVKSQGIFDQFRKECIADVDTKPAYQNLRTRVESSVTSFLNKQTWRPDLNKNQLRETLRKHIHDAPYLEVGVERIVDQVVNPKIYSVFMPQVEDVVYKFLGIERPKPHRNGACDLKDLLPKDLDPVSPESDRNSLKDVSLESVDEQINEITNGHEQKDDQKPCTSNIEENKTQDVEHSPIKKEMDSIENGESSQLVTSSPVKAILNSSFKSDETIKTEEEEEDSPVFEPIDAINLNESNMSNDSHLSGISELTSHRSRSPDFMAEFSRDNFDCSNQDSQLSKVSSNSRLSIVTDFGSSNHASTPVPDSKEDFKYTKDNFKAVREFDSNKDNKFNFEVIKGKDNTKMSNSSKENSRDDSDYKDNKNKEDSTSKSKYSKDKHDSRSSRDKDRDSRKHHSSKPSKDSRSKSKDKNESESQESKENSNKFKETKVKEIEKKEDTKEVKDLKDLYKEKIRELREKKELTEKEKLGKDNKDSTKCNKDYKERKESSSSREKDDYRKSHKSSSSSRSSSNHKSSRRSESKDSRERSSSRKRDDRHSSSKVDSRSSKSRRNSKSESKSESRSSDRSLKDKKRRDEKKSKPTDDHSSLRKNFNDRRSTDRDGSNGSSSKYSHKSSYGSNNSSGKPGPSASLTKDNNKEHHSNSETPDNVHDSLQLMFESSEYIKGSSAYNNLDNPPKRVDPGSAEICLPLKKRPLHDSPPEVQAKKIKTEDKKESKKKIQKDIFKIDVDVASVPDEERVQIIEIPDEEYDEPYPGEEPIISLEETKKIILDADPVHHLQSKLSEMEQSIRQSLSEMMSDHKINHTEKELSPKKLISISDSESLIETLTGVSNQSTDILLTDKDTTTSQNTEKNIEKIEEKHILQDDEKMEMDTKEIEKIIQTDNKNVELIIKDEIVEDKEILNSDIKTDQEFEDGIIKIENVNEHLLEGTEKLNVDIEVNIKKTDQDVKENVNEHLLKGTEKLNVDIEVNIKKTDQDVKVNVNENEEIQSGLEKVDYNIEKDTKKTDDYKELVEETESNIKQDLDKQSIKRSLEEEVQDVEMNIPECTEKKEQNIDVMEKSQSCIKVQDVEMNIPECTEKKEQNIDVMEKSESCIKVQDVEMNIPECTEKKEQNIDVMEKSDSCINISKESEEKNIDDNAQLAGNLVDESLQMAEQDYKIKHTGIIVDETVESISDNVDQDNNSIDGNPDELNEEDKLIIDEEFNDKESNVDEAEIKECSTADENLVKLTQNEEVNKHLIDDVESKKNKIQEELSTEKQFQPKEKDLEQKIINETIAQENNGKITTSNEREDNAEKLVDCVNIQKQIKDKLIDELSKLNKEESDIEKESDEDEMMEKGTDRIKVIEVPIEDDEMAESLLKRGKMIGKPFLVKENDEDLSQSFKNIQEKFKSTEIENEDEVKSEENSDSEEDDEETDKEPELVIVCEEKDETEEELSLVISEDTSTSDKISLISKDGTTSQDTQESEEPSTSGQSHNTALKFDRKDVVVSPIEEDCLYLESDNRKYLTFKRFLEKLEADPSRSLENMIESFGGVVVPAVPHMIVPASSTSKRKHSISPLSDISIGNANNNNDGSEKRTNVESQPEDHQSNMKKRKVGRMKKGSSSSTSTINSEQHQQQKQQPKQQLQQPKQHQSHQQPQVPMVNGENFEMPLSPESDVSATSEKNPGSSLRDDRRSHRNNQRYSSDDLYKPRPLFPSSSRRNRRFNQA